MHLLVNSWSVCQYILETSKWSLRLIKVYSILSVPRSSKWSLSSFLHQNPVSIIFSRCAVYFTHFIVLEFIIRMLSGKYKSWSSSYVIFSSLFLLPLWAQLSYLALPSWMPSACALPLLWKTQVAQGNCYKSMTATAGNEEASKFTSRKQVYGTPDTKGEHTAALHSEKWN